MGGAGTGSRVLAFTGAAEILGPIVAWKNRWGYAGPPGGLWQHLELQQMRHFCLQRLR